MALHHFHLSLSLLLCALPLIAQEEPPELVELRKKNATRALASARTLAEQFTKALVTIEKESGAAGDYEQALAAQQRRLELTQLYSQSLQDNSLSNTFVLKPADARLNGSVSFDKNLNALIGWKTVGSIANWDVSRLVPGNYTLSITYGVADLGDMPSRFNPYAIPPDLTTGGEFEFYEDSSLVGASQNRRTMQVTTTGGWDKLITVEAPPFQLGRTTARFALRISRTRGEGGVMHLKEIRLTPAKPTLAGAAEPSPEGQPVVIAEEQTALRVAYMNKLKDLALPVFTSYVIELKSLAEAANAKNDPESVEDLQAEQVRLERLLVNPSLPQLNHYITEDKKILGDGAEEWRGVRYVAKASNTGDRFVVSFQDQEVPVRLIGVRCPSHFEEDKEDLEFCAGYFRISLKDAKDLAKQARDFTESFLAGKDLRLLSRGLKDQEGRVLVTVQPEGVGDFAGVLVDNGLAAINAPKAKVKTQKRGEAALLAILKERENTARTRPIPPGGWAMSDEGTPAAKP